MVSRRVHWLTLSAKVSAQPRVGLKGYTEVASHIKCARTLKLRIFDEVHSFISKPEGDMIGSVWVQGLGHEYVQPGYRSRAAGFLIFAAILARAS